MTRRVKLDAAAQRQALEAELAEVVADLAHEKAKVAELEAQRLRAMKGLAALPDEHRPTVRQLATLAGVSSGYAHRVTTED